MTHQEILNKTKAEIDSLCAQAKEKLDAMAPKALEIGKWYKTPKGGLYCLTSSDGSYYSIYGFSVVGDWFGNANVSKSITNRDAEATPQEVKKALIEEAKRRYKVGDKLSKIVGDWYNGERYFNSINLIFKGNSLYVKILGDNCHLPFCIFKDGKWSTIIEQPVDKFAELKEAHRNGAVIQLKMGNRWFDCDPVWTSIFTYRIKPEEKLTLTDKDIAIIERLHDTLLDNHKYDLDSHLLSNARDLCYKINLIINNK